MSAIAGIFDKTHQIINQKNIFEKMIQSMKHHGTDDDSIYIDNHIALMHTSQDLTNDCTQPVCFQHYYIIFDGKCFNIDEINDILLEKNLYPKNELESILILYSIYKEKSLDYINGNFSFAIYDQNEQILFLARDHLGVKPLFYTFVDETLIFASEIKTLFTYPLVQPIINESSIHQLAYLGPGRIEGSGIFKNIFELKAGEYIIYNHEKFIKEKYYTLESKLHVDNYNDTIDNVKEIVTDSIENQMKDLDEFGCFLSGGLDSSIICAIGANYLSKKNKILNTFSLEFEDNIINFKASKFQPSLDSEYIQLMVDKYKLNHKVITLNNDDLLNALYKSVDARDLPGMADIDASLFCFCEKVRKEYKVVFSGECSDEIFGGYPWYLEDIESFPWTKNIEIRNHLLNDKYQINYKNYINKLYNQTLQETSFHDYDLYGDIRYKQMMNLHIHWFMQTLIDRNDRMSSAHGLEVRVPFCDINILNYVYNIPKSFKTVHELEKGLLREAMSDLLPEEIINRKKSPFPKTYHPKYLEILRTELLKLDEQEPLWIIFNKENVLNYFMNENNQPWYGQLMTTPQTIAYFIQMNYWLKKYKIKIQ